MVDRELCVQAADRALAYLRERVLDDTWVAAHRDIAYYFKAPQAFLLAGLRDEAAAAFDALEPFLDEGGAASGSAAYRLAYPHYPYMWEAKAARELGRTEVAAACDAMAGEHFGEYDLPPAISRYLVSQQRAHGGFGDDADAMDTVDQTAELACWLRMLPELAAATEPVSWTVAGF